MKDLTIGNPRKVLWRFSLALFVSVVFQQLYSIADTMIGGRYLGEDCLSAVGISYPIIMIFMAIALGSSIGCSVVIGKLFGAKKYRDTTTAISTTLICSLVLSVVLMAIGLLCADNFMNLLQTPNELVEDATTYYIIYMAGFVFLFLYNNITGIFTALGDSTIPLVLLICSSVINIILDIVFVVYSNIGIAGLAWATFIAQGLACICSFFILISKIKTIHIEEKRKVFSWKMVKSIYAISIPSILQQSFVSVGNLLIQILINGYGSAVIGGFVAGMKLNTFAITSIMTLSNGISSWTSQNLGAKNIERVKKGYYAGLELTILMVIPFFIAYYFFAKQLIAAFLPAGSTSDALQVGVDFLQIVAPFYFVALFKLSADGVLRGAGAVGMFMITTFSDLIIRVVLAFLFSKQWGVIGIWWSWPVGWAVGAILSQIFYWSGKWKKFCPTN